MKIIISPAKKMKQEDFLEPIGEPIYLEESLALRHQLAQYSHDQLREIWNCSEKVTAQSEPYVRKYESYRKTPAILAYDGIQYQYMAPTVFEEKMFAYVQRHLRIVSGLYGILQPMDGIYPYRLEMQAKFPDLHSLYTYWDRKLYDGLGDFVILNLASKEYADAILPYLKPDDVCITCSFCEELNGKLVQKGVYVKMARGAMVRYMAENQIESLEEIKSFCELSYRYREEYSSKREYVFVKEKEYEGSQSER